MRLTNEDARFSIAIRKRVNEALETGCSCGGASARLTRRLIAAHVTIHIQCETCGSSIAGALPRSEFYFWQQYPEWDATLAESYWQDDKKRQEYQAAKAQALRERQTDYDAWLAESPEWATLQRLVLNRAEDVCEACLLEPATQVHHLTCSYGKIPPAWELKAVCHSCHTKLHNEWKEGAARQEVSQRVREILG